MDAYLQLSNSQTAMETRIDRVIGPTFLKDVPIARFNEGFYLGSSNRFGYLGPACKPKGEPNERRILLMGDSYVMGMTVFDRHHFARTLKKELEESLHSDVFALNFGRPDFNLSNSYAYYLTFASQWDHDLVLFFVDRKDLIPASQVESGLYLKCRVEKGRLVIDRSFARTRRYRIYRLIAPILEHSSLARLLFNFKKIAFTPKMLHIVLDKLYPSPTPTPQPPDESDQNEVLGLPPVTRAILAAIASNPKAMLVLRGVANSLTFRDVAPCQQIIDLGPVFENLESRGIDPCFWPVSGRRGHWNHAAHRAVGKALAMPCRAMLGAPKRNPVSHPGTGEQP